MIDLGTKNKETNKKPLLRPLLTSIHKMWIILYRGVECVETCMEYFIFIPVQNEKKRCKNN